VDLPANPARPRFETKEERVIVVAEGFVAAFPRSLTGAYRFLVHERDGIFAPGVDNALRSMSLQVLETPVQAPQANAHCERSLEPPGANVSKG